MNLVITGDGSHTIRVPEINEHYHSTFGALAESMHVFINAGLGFFKGKMDLAVFEVGFGTGLNALLSCIEGAKMSIRLEYHALEKYPVDFELAMKLNYPVMIDSSPDAAGLFRDIHLLPWNESKLIRHGFKLHKIKADLLDYNHKSTYDLVYYDAFAPEKQPEMWTMDIFKKIRDALNPGGILVTYCVKGDVKRVLLAAGYKIEKLPGPVGKREMLRAG